MRSIVWFSFWIYFIIISRRIFIWSKMTYINTETNINISRHILPERYFSAVSLNASCYNLLERPQSLYKYMWDPGSPGHFNGQFSCQSGMDTLVITGPSQNVVTDFKQSYLFAPKTSCFHFSELGISVVDLGLPMGSRLTLNEGNLYVGQPITSAHWILKEFHVKLWG